MRIIVMDIKYREESRYCWVYNYFKCMLVGIVMIIIEGNFIIRLYFLQ